MNWPEPLCPACAGPLAIARGGERDCPSCARAFGTQNGFLDLRAGGSRADVEPEPLARGSFQAAFSLAERGAGFKEALEGLLLALDDAAADKLMQILREARGSWFPLLFAHDGALQGASGGACLYLGNALSGSVTPLANAGYTVTILDRCAERARFADLRNTAHSPGATRTILGGDARRLPFADASFDLVVQEDGLPDASGMFAHAIDECLRVSRGEIVLTADNRLAYKRSTGRRSEFHRPGPIEFARLALAPPRGERTIRGYKSLLSRGGFARPRAFALYPHARDFTHVVGLDEALPTLTVGPMERKNRIKLAARSIGLFPVFTPSFVLLGARAAATSSTTRIERILAELAQRIGEPRPRAEQVVGTRGNTIVIHTSVPGRGEDDPRGRWTLHVPLCPKNVPQLERHFRSLELVRQRFPSVPVPEPLVHGRLDGVWLTCERRLAGWTAPQFSGDRALVARMLRETAAHFATLVVRPPAPFTDADFEAQVGARFELVARHAAVPSTIANLERLRGEMRARLAGRPIARVLYHADLRGKHVQQARDGAVLGYLDWGTTEAEGLPLFDLLHLVVHQRKQERLVSAGDAWRSVLDRSTWRDDERDALEGYSRAVGLDEGTQRAILELYPVLVAAMAEANWDFSRPRWLHRQFGL